MPGSSSNPATLITDSMRPCGHSLSKAFPVPRLLHVSATRWGVSASWSTSFATARHATSSRPQPKAPRPHPSLTPCVQIIALRKQNLSIYDISRALAKEEHPLSPVAISLLLKAEGFARLPRRGDDERPATAHPIVADVADVRQLDLTPRHIKTDFLLASCGVMASSLTWFPLF